MHRLIASLRQPSLCAVISFSSRIGFRMTSSRMGRAGQDTDGKNVWGKCVGIFSSPTVCQDFCSSRSRRSCRHGQQWSIPALCCTIYWSEEFTRLFTSPHILQCSFPFSVSLKDSSPLSSQVLASCISQWQHGILKVHPLCLSMGASFCANGGFWNQILASTVTVYAWLNQCRYFNFCVPTVHVLSRKCHE